MLQLHVQASVLFVADAIEGVYVSLLLESGRAIFSMRPSWKCCQPFSLACRALVLGFRALGFRVLGV